MVGAGGLHGDAVCHHRSYGAHDELLHRHGFEGYTSGLGYPLCGGGRYDRLLFWRQLPAVGFAVSLDHLLTVLTRQKVPELWSRFCGIQRQRAGKSVAAKPVLRRQGGNCGPPESTYEEAFKRLEKGIPPIVLQVKILMPI